MKGFGMSRQNVEEIRDRLAAFEDAYNRENLKDVLSAWGTNFVDIPEALPALKGAEAHARRREGISARFRDHVSVLRIEPTEIVALGESAVLVHGRLTVTLRHRQTDALSFVHKRFMEVWVRDATGWAIQYEMANSGP
jgi:ketosteroid isomerase-like protein